MQALCHESERSKIVRITCHIKQKICRLTHFPAETGLYASRVKNGEYMCQSLDQGLALFHGLCARLPRLSADGLSAPNWKGRRSLPGNDSWQKGATGLYLRQFGSSRGMSHGIPKFTDSARRML
jgi:hypothetical protein